MYQLIKEVHSLSAYIVLVVLFLSTTNALIGYFTKKETYQVKDLRLNLFALIFAHIQLLLGLLLYVLTARGQDGNENQSVASFAFRTPIGDDYCGSAYYYRLVKTQKARYTSC